MLIVSKFHDYYDAAIGFGGVDKTSVYIRRTAEIKPRDKTYGGLKLKKKEFDYSWEVLAIGFCGKIYPFIMIFNIEEDYCFYDRESLEEFLDKHEVKASKRRRWCWSGRYSGNIRSEYYLGEKLDPNSWSHYNKLFEEHKCPVFLVGNGTFLNPVLKDYLFYKIFDSWTAFQEIYMYISGVLGNPEKNLIEIADKDQLHKKGFDDWSFKRLPIKKKKR